MVRNIKQIMRPALALLLMATFLAPAASGAVSLSIDLSTWAPRGDPANGNWVVGAGGTDVTQTVNGGPSYFVTPRGYRDTLFEGTLTLPAADDDFVGWTINHRNPSGTGTTHRTLILDWKGADQTANGYNAPEGFTLYSIDGAVAATTANHFACFWGKVDADCPADLTVLATNHGAGLGWEPSTSYSWRLRVEENLIRLHITGGTGAMAAGATVIAHAATTVDVNRFGFYTFEQAGAQWSTVSHFDTYLPTVTSDALCSTPGAAGWCQGSVDVSGSAVDHGAGMDTLTCRNNGVDGACAQTMGDDGVHEWRVIASDLAGNIETVITDVFIDTVLPEISSAVACTGGASTSACATSLDFGPTTGFDATSGLATLTCTLDGNPVGCGAITTTTDEGPHSYVIEAVDAAGHLNTTTLSGLLDFTQPTVTITSDCSNPGLGVWCRGTWDVTGSATDAGSGVNTVTCRHDGVVGPCAQTLSGDGIHQWRVVAVDFAGNSRTMTRNLRIDTTPAEITSAVACAGGAPVMACATSLAFGPSSAVDATSGVGSITCTLDGNPVACGAAAVTSDEGIHTYIVDVVDVAGNTNSTTLTGLLDFTLPVPVATVSCTPWWSNGWCQNTVRTLGTASDFGSGVASIECALDGQPYPCALTSTTVEGSHTFTVNATDNAGHVNSTSYSYLLDNTDPTGSFTAQETCLDPLCLDVNEVHYTVTASDALSGVHRVEYVVDGWIMETDYAPGPYEWTWDASTWGGITGLVGGSAPDHYGFFHDIEIRIIDVAGNFLKLEDSWSTLV